MTGTDKFKYRRRKMLIFFAILFGLIILYKVFQYGVLHWYLAKAMNEPVVVSSTQVSEQSWQSSLPVTASLRAITGVNISTESSGIVQKINFTPGTFVTQGTVLVQLVADVEQAALRALQANAALAQITYQRDQQQYAAKAISKQELDVATAQLANAVAQVDQQQAILDKKTIRAPFTGNIGLCQVNVGQYLKVGSMITTLQNLDTLYVDFYLPQQFIAQLNLGQKVIITGEGFHKKSFIGKITAFNPVVDDKTRNIFVEATINNADHALLPGMFVHANIIWGKKYRKLTLPQSAISFNPYGSVVFVVEDENNSRTVKQVFVLTGETRGDQIAIEQGLKAGDEVVTSGQIKLSNGSKVAINNKIYPDNNPHPQTPDAH